MNAVALAIDASTCYSNAKGTVRGVDFRIGMGVAWNTEDPTSSRDDIIDIARALVRRERRTATRSAPAYA